MDFKKISQMIGKALAGSGWRRERIECFLAMLQALFLAQSVNTHRLASRMGSQVQFESITQRVRRLLAHQNFDWEMIGKLILAIGGVPGTGKVTVAVDRTNWDLGGRFINFLVISVVVNGVGIPVVWEELGKKGNSKTKERVALLDRFLSVVPADRVRFFLADREFIGMAWFKALQDRGIPYAIRVRNNQFVTLENGKMVKISALAKTLKGQHSQTWPHVTMKGVGSSLSIKRLDDGKILAVVAFGLRKSADPLEIYRQRWGIELCFACLKTKGFNLEDTGLRHKERLEKIFALASLAAAAALRTGQDPDQKSKAATRKKTTASVRDLCSCAEQTPSCETSAPHRASDNALQKRL